MSIMIDRIEDGITLISLEGRLDLEGTQAIDNQFVFATSTKAKRIIVVLAQVTFITSIWIRTLLSGARGQQNRGGMFVLLNPQKLVRDVLVKTGFQAGIPI